jgi:hypothetical protein
VLNIPCVDVVLSRNAFCQAPPLDPVDRLTGELGIGRRRRHPLQYRSCRWLGERKVNIE